uniref:RNase_Zc3h12a domain-containing protein n=1 Tax=Heterorhabditis bacteriophora TaxID=37862 RepID=A0A1I7X9E1_HETBA
MKILQNNCYQKGQITCRRASVTGLLMVLRFFLKNDFDVIAISQHKYTFDGQVTHIFAMKRLMDMGLVVIPDNHCHDDVLALEAAHTTDGVVISNDQFK